MNPGDKVRLIANPGREGILGNETDGPPTRLRLLVTFPDSDEQFILKDSLEKVERKTPGPYAMIASGKYGRAKDVRGAIAYYRLSGKLANLIYSLNTTNTQFLAYQFKPIMHFLDSPCNGILIADEVGLGKTIEAGLIWTELRARIDARRLLVVCPAMLCEKWKLELADRFGVTADIVDARELLRRLQKVRSSPQDGLALIASLQGLRPSRGWNDTDEPDQSASATLARFLSEGDLDDPLLDLVIIDEAHYLRNRETQTHRLGVLLRAVAQNLVLLSATPIQLRSTDLFNLLHILDEDAFPFEQSFAHTLQANAPIVALRDRVLRETVPKEEFVGALRDALDARLFADNEQIEHLRNNPPSDEELASPRGRSEIADRLDRINPLAKVVTRTLKRDVDEFRVVRQPVAIKAIMHESERIFYDQVTERVRSFCKGMNISTGFMLTIPQRQMASSMAAACRGWIEKAHASGDGDLIETVYESFGDSESGNPVSTGYGPLLSELIQIARSVGDYQTLYAVDSKYAALIGNLTSYWRQNPGKKIVLFSFYRHTLSYLARRLLEDGVRSVVVHGGMDKQEALRQFAIPSGPNILLSSEVASEGVDLQFSSLVINYDLPWNPMRIEQRIGRIDRIGQQAEKILIWNFVYADTIDDRIYECLLERMDIFRRALGNMEAILGDQIRELGYDLLTHHLTPEQELVRIDRAKVAIETVNREQQRLETEATQLIAHGDFIQNKVRAARELGRYIQGEDLLAYVRDFFEREFPGTRLIGSDHDLLEASLELSTEARVSFSDFLSNHRIQGRTAILGARAPRLKFENKIGKDNAGVERITQDHPLIRFVAERLRMAGKGIIYFPVSALQLCANAIGSVPGVYVYAVTRWSVSGSRDIERLEYIAIEHATQQVLYGDDAEHLVNNAAIAGRDWDAARNVLDHHEIAATFEHCKQELENRFANFQQAYMREDRDRIALMVNTLQHHLEAQSGRIRERIDAYQQSGTDRQRRMVPAEEGRLRKLTERFQGKIAELKLKERSTAADSFVSGGVIHLT